MSGKHQLSLWISKMKYVLLYDPFPSSALTLNKLEATQGYLYNLHSLMVTMISSHSVNPYILDQLSKTLTCIETDVDGLLSKASDYGLAEIGKSSSQIAKIRWRRHRADIYQMRERIRRQRVHLSDILGLIQSEQRLVTQTIKLLLLV